MLNSWGERIGRRKARKELKSRKEGHPVDLNAEPPRLAWVLFILDEDELYQEVEELREKLKETHGLERVRAFAVLPDDEVPNMATAARDMEFIRSSDTGWTGKLKRDPLEGEEAPDLLIDLSDGRSVTLDHLVSSVPARLRIGRYRNERLPFYELMLETQEDEGVRDLIDRILRYLQLMMRKEE